MKLSTPLRAVLFAGAIVALPLTAWPSVGAEVGVAAAVKNDVEGVQGGTRRALSLGSRVFESEVIRTGAESIAQLLFLDQTTLSVGPESEVTLDRFVYDPARGTGDVLLSTARGALRFISGTQNPLHYKIGTPSATIGVRGTIVNVLQYGAGTTVVADQGTVVIDVGGKTYTVEAGKALAIGPGGRVSGPYTFDGVLTAFKHGVPWPLYPGVLPAETWEVEVPDDSTIRIEDLFDEMIDDDGPNCEIDYCECYPQYCEGEGSPQ